jgi:neutral ceramidase
MKPLLAALSVLLSASLFGQAASPQPSSPPPVWSAGAAAVDITPDGPVWLAGFANRKVASQGVGLRIFTKALAIQDASGGRMVIATLDLVGIPRQMRADVERRASERYGLRPECLLINASHTHSAPAISREEVEEPHAYFGTVIPAGLAEKAEAYRATVADKLVEVIGAALAKLRPAELDYSHARAGFAMNRRLPVGNQILHEGYPDGPVDPDVPVLRVKAADGAVIAILFGYACHNTSVTGVCPLLNGDYAGFAQKDLEAAHPGAVALFLQGAAGDQNPYPRGPITYAERYGQSLADAVEAALIVTVHHPVHGPLQSALAYAPIKYAQTSRAELEQRTRTGSAADRARAGEWLKQLDATGKLPASYPCPVQVVRFGTDLVLIGLGGEPTVEYGLRLKRELKPESGAVWFAGYSNDVFGYLGSRKVLEEGGYEGYDTNAGSRVHPGPYALGTEDQVVGQVHALLQQLNH